MADVTNRNKWDNGSIGNFWSDYMEKYPDAEQIDGVWDTPYNISGGNHSDGFPSVYLFDICSVSPPEKPSMPSGPVEGAIGVEYTYTSSASDPDGDDISYLFDWGDGTTSGWTLFVASGEEKSVKHAWQHPENYSVRVKAKDIYEDEGEWSDILWVNITTP